MSCREASRHLPESRAFQSPAALVLTVLIWGCEGAVPARGQQDAIHAWLECAEECDELLAPAFAVANGEPSRFERALRDGPSAARIAEHQAALARNWERVYGDPEIPKLKEVQPLSKEAYVDLFVGNLIHRYRVRASTALVEIGDGESLKILTNLLAQNETSPFLREDTKAALESARQSLQDRLFQAIVQP